MATSESRDHLAPDPWFSQTEGRGAKIQNHFGSLVHERADRFDLVKLAWQITLRPDVFADCDADLPLAEHHGSNVPRRFEVAVFIKNVVGREKRFVGDR